MKKLIFYILAYLHIHKIFQYWNQDKAIILMYHGVSYASSKSKCWWHMPIDKFKWQMTYLKKNYHVISLEEYVNCIKLKKQMKKVAIITFDDGYMNNFTNAYPILKDLGLPATIFITTNYINTNNLIWHDMLFLYLQQIVKNKKKYCFIFDDLKLLINSQKSFEANIDLILKKMKSINENARASIIESIQQVLDDKEIDSSECQILDKESIYKISEDNSIRIGAHTCSHAILSQLEAVDKKNEIEKSLEIISQILPNQNFKSFAFPNGGFSDFDKDCLRILKEKNCDCAVTSIVGLADDKDDLYLIKRIPMAGDLTKERFKLLISGCIFFLKNRK